MSLPRFKGSFDEKTKVVRTSSELGPRRTIVDHEESFPTSPKSEFFRDRWQKL